MPRADAESGGDGGRRAVTKADTAQFLRQFMEQFAAFIGRVYTVLPRNA
jgi:hypothetical protein